MKNLKYLALLPIAGEAGYGSYLMASSPALDSSTPREVPNTGGPTNSNGQPVLEDAPESPAQEEPKETAKAPPEKEQPSVPNNAPSKPVPEAKPVADQRKDPVPEPVDQPVEEVDDSGSSGEMIERAGEGSIGYQYQQYLIGTKESSLWNKKMETWKTNHTENRNNEPFVLTGKNPFTNLKEKMTNRCQNAYKLNSFKAANVKGGKQLEKEQYWAMVWTYCSKPTAAQPEGWGKVV